jgi:hypothetical protein
MVGTMLVGRLVCLFFWFACCCSATPVTLAQGEWADETEDSSDEEFYRYQSNPERVRLRSTISEQSLARFRNGEPIVVRVPEGASHIVSSLIVQIPESFKTDVADVRPRTRMHDGNVLIELPQRVFDRLEYQPLEIPVFQSYVKNLLLVPSAPRGGFERSSWPEKSREAVRSDDQAPPFAPLSRAEFYLRLKPKNGVTVNFRPDTSFKLITDILEMEFPFSEIEAIFFNDGEEPLASVVLRNGDNFTGKHDWRGNLRFDTPWGPEMIEFERLASISRQRGVGLVLSGVENPRWVLARFKN